MLPGGGTHMPTTAHNVSDVGLNFVTPVYALDKDITRIPSNGGIGLVTLFDGTKWLPPSNTMVEARVMVPAYNAGGNLDVLGHQSDGGSGFPQPVDPDNGNHAVAGVAVGRARNGPCALSWLQRTGGSRGAVQRSTGRCGTSRLPGSNPAIKDGATVQLVFTLDDGLGHILPCAYGDPNDPSVVRPFEFGLHSVVQQRGEVTITNNVINPTAGQTANLHYVLQKSGNVTVTVFDLSGSIITVLVRGSQAAGTHITSWDGKNRSGAPVARGIYFIRAVGPDFDEIRKVLVVR